MEEVTQEILQSIANFQKEMEKTFREFWDKFSKYTVSLGMFEPLVDIEDRSDEVVIYMDLPGFSKNEIKIKVTEDSVEVRAEKSIERKNVEKERGGYSSSYNPHLCNHYSRKSENCRKSANKLVKEVI